eukprot:IDg21874t1
MLRRGLWDRRHLKEAVADENEIRERDRVLKIRGEVRAQHPSRGSKRYDPRSSWNAAGWPFCSREKSFCMFSGVVFFQMCPIVGAHVSTFPSHFCPGAEHARRIRACRTSHYCTLGALSLCISESNASCRFPIGGRRACTASRP